MAIKNVKEYFKKLNLDDKIILLDESTATVELAAKALGTETNNIAKSLAFLVDDKPILIITSGDARIDNSKYKNYFKTKASMIKKEQVKQLIGHSTGGVCPFAINENVRVYLDNSLRNLTYVYPACGSSNSAIKLTIDQLEKYSNYINWIDVCK